MACSSVVGGKRVRPTAKRRRSSSVVDTLVVGHQRQKLPGGVGVARGHVLVKPGSDNLWNVALSIVLSADIPDQRAFHVNQPVHFRIGGNGGYRLRRIDFI